MKTIATMTALTAFFVSAHLFTPTPAPAQPLTTHEHQMMGYAIQSGSPVSMRAAQIGIFYRRHPIPLTQQESDMISNAILANDWATMQSVEFILRMNRQ